MAFQGGITDNQHPIHITKLKLLMIHYHHSSIYRQVSQDGCRAKTLRATLISPTHATWPTHPKLFYFFTLLLPREQHQL